MRECLYLLKVGVARAAPGPMQLLRAPVLARRAWTGNTRTWQEQQNVSRVRQLVAQPARAMQATLETDSLAASHAR